MTPFFEVCIWKEKNLQRTLPFLTNSVLIKLWSTNIKFMYFIQYKYDKAEFYMQFIHRTNINRGKQQNEAEMPSFESHSQ